MKDNKGFTLVELIAVIVILGIVLTITAVTISNVREKTLETQYKNLKTTIKVAAQSYHEETGVMKVPVLVLLQKGVVEADGIAKQEIEYEATPDNVKYTVTVGDPVLYDPRDKDLTLNCDYIDFDESEKGKYISANTNDDKNGCTAAILGENSVAVQIWYKLKNQEEDDVVLENYDPTKWYSLADGQKLKYKPNAEERLDTYFWTSDSAPDELLNEGADLDVVLPPSGLVDTEYTLTTSIDGSEFSNKFRVRADGKYPTVEDAYLIGGDSWTKVKTIKAHLRDNESGLKQYEIYYKDSKGNTKTAHTTTYNGEEGPVHEDEINIDVTAEGTYYIKLKDNADNQKTSTEKFVVKNVDATSPTMKLSVSNGDQYKKSHRVTVEITDKNEENPDNVAGFDGDRQVYYMWSDGSQTDNGVITLELQEDKTKLIGVIENYNAGGKSGNGTLTITDIGDTIEDLAGNKLAESSTSKELKLDNTPPTCVSSGGSTSWTNGKITLIGTCSDTGGSGCKENITKEYTSEINSNSETPGTVYDNAGNSANCPANQSVKIDKTKPSCTSSGGSASWTNGSRTLTGTCSDTGGSGCKDNVTKEYTTNTNSTTESPGTVYDNAGNSKACPANQTVKIDKTAPTCTSSGGSASWTNGSRTLSGTCSDTGGSGCKENVTKTYSSEINSSTESPGIVYDNAGNSTTCPNQTVKIDKTAPTCTSSGGSTTWTKNNITLTGTCSDTGGSGCKEDATKPYTTNTNLTNQSPGTVYDNAGNSVNCPANQTVKIDKTAPTCTSSGGSATWTNGSRTLTGTCSDTGGSGCKEDVTKEYTTNTNSTTESPGTVYDNAGNSVSCPSNQTVKIDKTAPTCTSSGGSTYWTNGNKTLTGKCSDTGGSGCKENVTKTYSSDINSSSESPGTVYDNAGNSVSCPANQTVKIDTSGPTFASTQALKTMAESFYQTLDSDGSTSTKAKVGTASCSGSTCSITVCVENKQGEMHFINGIDNVINYDISGKYSASYKQKTYRKDGNETETLGCLSTRNDDPCLWVVDYYARDNAGNYTYDIARVNWTVYYIGRGCPL